MWFVACCIEREKKRKQTKCQDSSHNSRLTWKLKIKERKKGEMFGVFVGVFEILKKKGNESKKERLKKLSDL